MAITYQVGFKLDDSEIEKGLGAIHRDIQNAFHIKGGLSDEIKTATKEAMVLEKALKKATTDKGISYNALTAELRKAGTSAGQLTANLAKGGQQFQASLNAANTALAMSNRQVLVMNSKIAEMARVFTQSFKFTAAQTILRSISSEAQAAVRWVANLNDAVNDIAVVTGKTGADLDKVTQAAIKGSRELRVAAADYAEGALIFYQQGLNDDEVTRRNEITIKAAKAANQSIAEMSSELTAIWNTYGMVGDEQMRAAAVGAKMAAETAVDFAQIAEAMQSAAAPAAQMGVSYNSLASIIATVGDTTQQSASVIGNAFKTIFSRFEQLKSDGTDGEVTLGQVSKQLQNLGVNVLDASGELRKLDDVINEVGEGWDKWSSKQQLAIAQLVGGTRQYGQFLALMNNFDKYQKNLNSAAMEDGSTLEQQYAQALDSIESRAENAAEAWHRAFANVINADQLKVVYTIMENIGEVFGGILKAMGGAPGALLIIGSLLSSKIVPAMTSAAMSAKTFVQNLTPAGRQAGINKDFNVAAGKIDDEIKKGQKNGMSDADQRSLEVAKEKNEITRRTALINDEINTKLQVATGEYKIELEWAKQQLQNSQDLYQVTLDRLDALDREAQMAERTAEFRKQELDNLIQAAQIQSDKVNDAQAEFDAAQKNVEQKRKAKSAAETKLSGATTKTASKNAEKELAQSRKELQQAEERLAKARQKLTAETEKLDKAEAKVISAGGKQQQTAKAVESSLLKLQSAMSRYRDEGQKGFSDVATAMTNSLNEIQASGTVSEESIEALKLEIASLGDGSNVTGEQLAQIQQKIVALGEASGGVTEQIADMANRTEEAAGDLQRAGSKLDAARGSIEKGGGDNTKVKKSVGEMVSGFTQVTMSAMMAVTAINSVFDALTNPDGDPTEKIGAVITAFISVVPALTGIMGGLQSLGAISMVEGGKIAIAGTTAQIPWIAFIAIIALVVLAIAGITKGISELAEATHKKDSSEMLESMKEAAEGLANAADEAKRKADALRDSIENYDSAVDALNNCTKGTEEWTNALKAANKAAMSLVDNLPNGVDISELYTRNAQGLIEFNQTALEAIQKQADIAAEKANYAAQIGKLSVQQAQNEILKESVQSASWGVSGTTDESGEYIPVIDTIQANLEYLGDSLDSQDFKNKLEALGLTVWNADADLETLRLKTIDLAEATEQAADKAKLLAAVQVDNILGDDFSVEVKNVMTDRLANLTEDYEQMFLGALTNGKYGSDKDKNRYGDVSKGQTKIDSKLLAEYNQLTGKNWVSSQNGVQGYDSNRFFEFLTENGETVKLSAEQVAQEMAAAKALEELTGSAERAASMMKDLDSKGAAGSALKNFFKDNNFNSLTQTELKDLFGSKSNVTTDSVRNYLENIYGGAAELEAAAAMMGKSVDQFVADVRKGAIDSFDAISNVGQTLSKTPKAILATMKTSSEFQNLTVEAQQEIAATLGDVFARGGKDAALAFQDIFMHLGDKSDEFANAVNQIDWQDASVEYAISQLEAFGITADDISGVDIPRLIEIMQVAADVSLESAQEQYAAVKDVADSISGEMATISQEQAQTLADAGIAVDAYFTQLADGTYQLIGDASEFKSIVESIAMKPLQDALMQAQADVRAWSAGAEIDPNRLGSQGFNTDQKLDMLAASGYDSTKLQELYVMQNDAKNYHGSSSQTNPGEYAKAVQDAFNEAGIDSETIQANLKRSAEEAMKIQEAIEETEFRTDVENFGLDLEETSAHAKRLAAALKEEDKALGNTEKSAADYERTARKMSIANQRLNRGVSDCNDNLETYKNVLTDANKGTIEWSNTMDDFKTNLADIFNVADKDMFTDTFAEAMLASDDFAAVLDGDIEALDRLRLAATEDIVMNIESNVEMSEIELENYQTAWETVKGLLEDGLTAEEINDESFITSLNEMIAAAGMSKEQITSMLGSMGVDAKIHTEYEEQEMEIPTYDEYSEAAQTHPAEYDEENNLVRPASWSRRTYTIPGPPYKAQGYVPVYSLETVSGDTSTGGSIQSISPGKISPSNTTTGKKNDGKKGGGGSGKTYEPVKAKRNKPMEERYANITSKIDETTRAINRLNAAEDDAWGMGRIRQMQAVGIAMQKQAQNYQILLKEARAYYDADQKQTYLNEDLVKAGRSTDIANIIRFNQDEGTIANREDLVAYWNEYLKTFEDKMIAAADVYNKTLDEATDKAYKDSQDAYNEAKEFVDAQMALYDQLDETAKKVQDTIDMLVQSVRDQVRNALSQIQYKVEFRIRVNERDTKRLERLLDRMGEIGILNGEDVGILDSMISKIQDKFDINVKGANEGMKIISDLQSAMGKDGIVDQEIRSKVIDFFGVSEEILDEYLKGNGGLPDEIMQFLQDQRDTLEETFDALIDTLIQQLDNVYTRFEKWIDSTFGSAERTMSKANAWLDQMQTLLDFKGTANYTEAGQTAQKEINAARMNAAVTDVKTKYANYTAYKDMAKTSGENAQKLKDEAAAKYGAPLGMTWKDMIDNFDSLDAATQNAVIGYQAGITELESKQQEYIASAEELEVAIIEAETNILNVARENIEKEKEMAKTNIATAINGLFSDIADMASMYDMMEAEKNQKFDAYDKNYHLTRLQDEYDRAIADMDEDQLKKLGDWQERLNKFKEEGMDLDENGLSLLEKSLEIELARAKLADEEDAKKDAREQKNTMRLARDASGNYSYIYSGEEAEEDNSQAEAKAQLAQLEYEYKKLLESSQDAYNRSVMDAALQLQEVIEGIDYQLYESSELYRKSIDVKISSLSNQLKQAGKSAEDVLGTMGAGVINWSLVLDSSTGEAFGNMDGNLGDLEDGTTGFVSTFKDSTLGILLNADSMDGAVEKLMTALVGKGGFEPGKKEGYYGNILEAQRYWAEDAENALIKATEDMEEEHLKPTWGLITQDITGEVQKIAGPNGSQYEFLKIKGQEVATVTGNWLLKGDGSLSGVWGQAEVNIGKKIGPKDSKDPNQINGMLNNLQTKMSEIAKHQNEELKKMTTDINGWSSNFCSQIQKAIDKIGALINEIDRLENAQAKAMEEDTVTITEHTDPTPSQPPAQESTPPPAPSGPTPLDQYPETQQMGVAFAVWNGTCGWGNGEERKRKLNEKFGPNGYSTYQSVVNRPDVQQLAKGSGWMSKIGVYSYDQLRSKYGYAAFKLGGLADFTGPAWLDGTKSDPELVLNPQDTQNILAAVEGMRQLVAEKALALGSRNIGGASLDIMPRDGQVIQQQVQIDATFPGVSVAREVEEALANLLRQVAQYNIDR